MGTEENAEGQKHID